MEWWQIIGLVLLVLALGPFIIWAVMVSVIFVFGMIGAFFESRLQRRLDRHYDD